MTLLPSNGFITIPSAPAARAFDGWDIGGDRIGLERRQHIPAIEAGHQYIKKNRRWLGRTGNLQRRLGSIGADGRVALAHEKTFRQFQEIPVIIHHQQASTLVGVGRLRTGLRQRGFSSIWPVIGVNGNFR